MANYYRDQHQGYLGPEPKQKINQYMVIDDRVHEIHNVVVHKFSMGDVDDPELYAAQPLYEWEKSEAGKWVMKNAVETPMWHKYMSPGDYSQVYAITAKLKAKDHSYFLLKWGKEGTLK